MYRGKEDPYASIEWTRINDLLPSGPDWSRFFAFRDAVKKDETPSPRGMRILLEELKKQDRLNVPHAEFLVDCFGFLMNNLKYWPTIVAFTGSRFGQMNRDVESYLQSSRSGEKPWVQLMTSKNLPIVPDTLVLARCFFSSQKFNIADAPFFDTYRPSSTTLHKSGICIGREESPNAEIYSFIRVHGVRGLALFLAESEVVLVPGIRFTWNKSAVDDIPLTDTVRQDPDLIREDGQYAIRYPVREPEYYRIYDVTFIEHPVPSKFLTPEIAERVKLLKKGLHIVKSTFSEHKRAQAPKRKERANARVKEYLFQSRERARQRIRQKAIVNVQSQIAQEEKKLLLHEIKLYSHNLPLLLDDALRSEKLLSSKSPGSDRKAVMHKFLEAEKNFEFLVAEKVIASLRPDAKLFRKLRSMALPISLSSYAKTYAPGITAFRAS
jgi:hypothetical protein